MPEVSVETVRRLLAARGMRFGAQDDVLLRAARADSEKLAATLLSLWESEGRDLTPSQQAELAAHRERLDYYRRTWDVIAKSAPDAFVVKGASIAALYPQGVLRSAGDLDVVCPSHDDVWAAATCLLADDWDLAAFTVMAARPGDGVTHHLLVEFSRPGSGELGVELSVGLTTAEIITITSRPPYRLARPPRSPLAANLVALTAELWERDYRSRDLLDLVLLAERLTPQDVDALRDGLARTGLWPEWQTLGEAVTRLGWLLPVALPEAPRAARRERATRLARGTARWSSPVRALAYAAQYGVDRDSAPLADRAADLLHERVGAHRVLALGLPLFGVPLGGPEPTASGLELVRAGRHLLARSPVGSYLLAAGACRQEWIDEAAEHV